MIKEKKLAFKYLCKKKSRSLATLFAIALSVFLIFVSGNLFMSAFYASKQADLKIEGNHIAYLESMNMKKVTELEKDGAVICALENSKYFVGDMGTESRKAEFECYYFEDFSKFPYDYEIIEGKVPEQPSEIMLHKTWKYYLGEHGEIGDRITIEGMENELGIGKVPQEGDIVTKTYILAGYYDCPEFSWLEDQVVLVKDNPRTSENSYRVYITSEKEGIEDLESLEGFEEKEDWARNLGDTYGAKVVVNWMFQKSQSTEYAMGYCLILIAGAFIGGFAVIVIRNAFVISIVERTRDYGMLRCIGASKKQIRKIAVYEAVMLGVAGEVAGLISSYLFLYLGIEIGKRYFSLSEDFKVVHRPILIFGTCLIIFVVVLFGLLEPTRQINKLKPLNALRNQKDVKKERFRIGKNTGRLIGKIFGVEGEYAYKNLLRNRRKFITTTASCVVAVTFFVGINAAFVYSKQIFKVGDLQYYPYYNAELNVNEKDLSSVKKVMKKLEDMEGVGNVTFVYRDYYLIDYDSLRHKEDGSGVKGVAIIAIDEENYPVEQESVVEGNVGDCGLGECYIVNWDTEVETNEEIELCEVSLNDKLELHKYVYGQDSMEPNISELEIKAILKEYPLQGAYMTPHIIVSEECFKALCQEQKVAYEESAQIYLKMDEDCDVSKVQDFADANGMMLYDYLEMERRSARQTKTARVIVNAFLILVAMISSMNLFNSMESNLILREKERKMMRAIGMSLRQYRKMILLEGMLSVIIALVLGTALGLGFGYGIFRLMVLTYKQLTFTVPVGSIICAGAGLTLLTVLTSLGGMKEVGIRDK
ncbi:MAG: FtsX-like permease family protein [Lachnospiraceae bacterium]|nr:FtsX-like permease family protein [Lachnospiraceae bacterium]